MFATYFLSSVCNLESVWYVFSCSFIPTPSYLPWWQLNGWPLMSEEDYTIKESKLHSLLMATSLSRSIILSYHPELQRRIPVHFPEKGINISQALLKDSCSKFQNNQRVELHLRSLILFTVMNFGNLEIVYSW